MLIQSGLFLTCAVLLLLSHAQAFKAGPTINSRFSKKYKAEIIRRDFLPAAFAATCAGAVIAYVYFNIDDIKEKQKLATDRAMQEQTVNIQNAQDSQRKAIEAAQLKQQEAIRKIAEDAAKRR